MSLTDEEKASLSKLEASMARKGFDLGTLLNRELGFPAEGPDPGDGGSFDPLVVSEAVDTQGVETRVLPGPPLGYVGMKLIAFGDDQGNFTILADNVVGFTVENFTFTDAGQQIALLGNGGARWIQIGGDVTPA